MVMLLIKIARTGAAAAYSFATAIVACLFLFNPRWMWLRFPRPWSHNTLKLAGITLDIEGMEHLHGPAVFVSNHQSTIDVVFLPGLLPHTVMFLAKKELLRVPFWGWAFGRSGAILIDRRDPQGAIHSIQNGLKRLPAGWSVAVFPEGTRSPDGKLQSFKKGAFHIARETGLPIVPIGLMGAREVMPKYSLLLQPGTIYVTAGAPMAITATDGVELEQQMRQVHEQVQRLIDRSVARRDAAVPARVSEALDSQSA